MGDAAGDVEPPQKAAGELARAELHVVLEAHERDGLVHEPRPLAPIVHVQGTEEVDVLPHGELLEQRHVLRHHADLALQVVARGRHGLAEQADVALVEGEQLQYAIDGRRLARTVRAQKPEDLAGLDAQIEVVERHHVSVALHQVAHLDDGRRHSAGPCAIVSRAVALRAILRAIDPQRAGPRAVVRKLAVHERSFPYRSWPHYSKNRRAAEVPNVTNVDVPLASRTCAL